MSFEPFMTFSYLLFYLKNSDITVSLYVRWFVHIKEGQKNENVRVYIYKNIHFKPSLTYITTNKEKTKNHYYK